MEGFEPQDVAVSAVPVAKFRHSDADFVIRAGAVVSPFHNPQNWSPLRAKRFASLPLPNSDRRARMMAARR
jgi:hypothetical protein